MKRLLVFVLVVVLCVASVGCQAKAPRAADAPVSTAAPSATTTTTSAPAPAPGRVKVPNLKGKSATGAAWRLEQLGLKSKIRWTRASAPRGRVIAQKPSGGKLPTGRAVTLTISSGSKQSGQPAAAPKADSSNAGGDLFARLFEQHRSDVAVTGVGTVARVLADDNDGGRHQRFIVRLGSGQTLLVAHNIDIAPRIPSLAAGAPVRFKGVYEWNSEGGVVHWTHRDPSGDHAAGWLKYKGATYK